MPTTISAEQKAELLRRLELARAAKAAKQQEKAEAKPASKSRAKKSDLTASSKSTPTPVPPPAPQTLQEPTGHLISQSQPEHQPEAEKSTVTTSEPESVSFKTATVISSSSVPAETPSKTIRGKKKVCLPTESDSDSDEEEEKPKKRGRKPYATIVLHREPKKSIDKVINRLARIESDSSSSEDDDAPMPSEPIPIPQARNTRPKPPQTHSIHNQEQQRKEMLRQLALEYYG